MADDHDDTVSFLDVRRYTPNNRNRCCNALL